MSADIGRFGYWAPVSAQCASRRAAQADHFCFSRKPEAWPLLRPPGGSEGGIPIEVFLDLHDHPVPNGDDIEESGIHWGAPSLRLADELDNGVNLVVAEIGCFLQAEAIVLSPPEIVVPDLRGLQIAAVGFP